MAYQMAERAAGMGARHRRQETGQAAGDVARVLGERAESYAADSARFADAGRLGQPIVTAGDDANFAVMYRVIADELRKVRTALLGGELPA